MTGRQETALEWVARVRQGSRSKQAKTLAAEALREWARLMAFWRSRGLKTRRSLWDLLAGVSECHQRIRHDVGMTLVESDGEKFYFPIFIEAVQRRAKDVKAAPGAVRTGVPIRSFRAPQTKKWGNTVCKT